MKKRISSILFAVALCLCCASQAFAASDERELPRLVDNGYTMTDDEGSELLAQLDEISERQECDVLVITVESMPSDYSSITEYADDVFDYNGYGLGDDRSGILLLLDMEGREWAISTCGYGIVAFTDSGQEYMVEHFKPDLSDGNYSDAFSKYAVLCDEFLTKAKAGEPYDSGNLPKEPLSKSWILIALFVGVLFGFLFTGIMKSKLKSVRSQAAAGDYVKSGSMNITDSRDTFLYKMVTSVKKEDNDSSGSSTHTSSSGTTHGGSSGGF